MVSRKAYKFTTLSVLLAVVFIYTGQSAVGQEPAPFVAFCEQPAPGIDIADPEFNPEELLAAWIRQPRLRRNGTVRRHGKVRVAEIDPDTGLFMTSSIKSVRGSQPLHGGLVVNGPEWSNSQFGWELFYSCYSADETTVRLCTGSRTRRGRWRNHALPSSDGLSSRNPTKNPDSPVPKLYFQRYTGTIAGGLSADRYGWREDTDTPINVFMKRQDGQGRWLPDARRLIHIKKVFQGLEVIGQLALYDSETLTDEVLFFDGRQRRDPFPWSAPELGGKTAIAAMVLDEARNAVDIEVYREDELDGWVLWTVIESIDSQYNVNFSPEAFVFDGRSYLSMVSFDSDNIRDVRNSSSIVWFTTVDPDLPAEARIERVLTPSDGLQRSDPEPLVIANTAVVYFITQTLDQGRVLLKCDTDLLPKG